MGEEPYTGPPCPSCNLPTRGHCFTAACPWTVCVNRHFIRVADQHVSEAEHAGRPTLLTNPRVDGYDDLRGLRHWGAVYDADKTVVAEQLRKFGGQA
jgi:hypothetical protein